MSFLRIEKVGFSYPRDGGTNGAPPFALRDVSVSLEAGELLGVLGPNGSGKSTLLRLLCRVLTPSSGQIFLNGWNLNTLSEKEVARHVALVPQEMSTVFSLTVEQMVTLGLFARSRLFGWRPPATSLDDILTMTDLWPLRHRLTSHLSGGEKRRVLLARALAQKPQLLLLDEPTAHLDPRHQLEFVQLVDRLRRQMGVAVVAVLHDLRLAQAWCPRLLMLKEGRQAAQGVPEEVLTAPLLQQAYGLTPQPGAEPLDFFHVIRQKGENL